MALLTASSISTLAVELLARSVVLPGTVAAIPGTEFAGDNGDTITVRVRQPRTAKTQATPGATITYTPLDETAVSVTVEHLYDATRVTDEQLTLEIADFGAQVLQPMTAAVAAGAEDQVAAVMNGLPVDDATVTASTVEDAVLAAREALGSANVPTGDRYLAVSPAFATVLLRLDNLSDVSAAGSPGALREATIGRYRGFNVVESNALTAGTAVAYHRSGIVWGNRAPAIPDGAASAAASVSQGIALRTVRDFDPSVLSDVVAISTFAGAALVDADRVYKLALTGSS